MFRRIAIILTLLGAGVAVYAQNDQSSLNAFSPYTMYGIGDLSIGGNVASRAMGGIGVAMRKPNEFNYANPASLSAIPRQTAVFNFGMVSSNYYQKMGSSSNSYNSVDLHDIGFAIPLYKGIGIGLSLTPVSAVGYNTMIINNNPNIIQNIGRSVYTYDGEGGVSQLAVSLGIKVFAGLSLGASLNYNFGSIERAWESTLLPLVDYSDFRVVTTTESLRVDKFWFSVGGQYQIRVGDDDNLTLGATYTPRMAANMNSEKLTFTSSSVMEDTVSLWKGKFNMTMPEKLAVGVYFSNAKLGIGFDYYRQDWRNAFVVSQGAGLSLGVVNDFRLGAQYTPDRYNIRSLLSRWTYKVGGRYATSYMVKDGHQLSEWAVTAGLDIPLKMRNLTAFNLGIEVGERGARNVMVKETYFKVFFGLSLFGGDDMWFVKRKFN